MSPPVAGPGAGTPVASAPPWVVSSKQSGCRLGACGSRLGARGSRLGACGSRLGACGCRLGACGCGPTLSVWSMWHCSRSSMHWSSKRRSKSYELGLSATSAAPPRASAALSATLSCGRCSATRRDESHCRTRSCRLPGGAALRPSRCAAESTCRSSSRSRPSSVCSTPSVFLLHMCAQNMICNSRSSEAVRSSARLAAGVCSPVAGSRAACEACNTKGGDGSSGSTHCPYYGCTAPPMALH